MRLLSVWRCCVELRWGGLLLEVVKRKSDVTVFMQNSHRWSLLKVVVENQEVVSYCQRVLGRAWMMWVGFTLREYHENPEAEPEWTFEPTYNRSVTLQIQLLTSRPVHIYTCQPEYLDIQRTFLTCSMTSVFIVICSGDCSFKTIGTCVLLQIRSELKEYNRICSPHFTEISC